MRFRPHVAKLGVVTVVAAMLLSAESCKEPTSVEIEVRTTLQPNEVRGTQFFVGGDPSALESDVGNGYPSAETTNAGADGFVGTLVSIPPDGESGSLSIIVVLGFSNAPSACRPQNGYKGCIVARRRLAYRKIAAARPRRPAPPLTARRAWHGLAREGDRLALRRSFARQGSPRCRASAGAWHAP